jgi:hypothetical protein
MAIRWTTSRLPVTPGDLLMRTGLSSAKVVLEADSLQHVLLVRSFPTRDRLKPLLENAIRMTAANSSRKLELEVVDVDTADAFFESVGGVPCPYFDFRWPRNSSVKGRSRYVDRR